MRRKRGNEHDLDVSRLRRRACRPRQEGLWVVHSDYAEYRAYVARQTQQYELSLLDRELDPGG